MYLTKMNIYSVNYIYFLDSFYNDFLMHQLNIIFRNGHIVSKAFPFQRSGYAVLNIKLEKHFLGQKNGKNGKNDKNGKNGGKRITKEKIYPQKDITEDLQ